MDLDIVSYHDLMNPSASVLAKLENALLSKGIVGISHAPDFEAKSRAYVQAARNFSALPDSIKQQYAPDRDAGDTEGYEQGAEWFKDEDNNWQIDDKKASFYAYVPNHEKNKWPEEVDLRTSYLALGELIYATGKHVLAAIGLDNAVKLNHTDLVGYGRMLHYHKESDATNANPNWCGAHLDHGVFTGLMPAHYFRDGKEIDEPEDAGLYIVPTHRSQFEKVHATDKSVLLFQVGEFGQLLSNDRIRATKHQVRKATGEIERYAFALFYSASANTIVDSTSILINDKRYADNKSTDNTISYAKWEKASYERYRAK